MTNASESHTAGFEFLALQNEKDEVYSAVEGLGLIMAQRMRYTAIQKEIARLESEVEAIELQMKERNLLKWF